MAGLRTRSSARLKLTALKGEPSLKRSPGRTVNLYVRRSEESAGTPAAASGRNLYPAGAGASRNAIKVAQVASQSGPHPRVGCIPFRAGSTVGGGPEGRRMRSVPPLGAALVKSGVAAPTANAVATPSATSAAGRRQPTRRL